VAKQEQEKKNQDKRDTLHTGSQALKSAGTVESSDDEDMAGESSLYPGTFTGIPGVGPDAEDWLTAVEGWILYKGLSQEKTAGAISLMLKGVAQTWYQSLPVEAKMDFGVFSKQFLKRYVSADVNNWRSETDVFDVKQAKSESVSDYIARFVKKQQKVKLEPRLAMNLLLRNMNPKIRQCIVTKEYKTLEELMKLAIDAELAGGDLEAEPEAKMDAILAELKIIRAKQSKAEAVTVAAVSATTTSANPYWPDQLHYDCNAISAPQAQQMYGQTEYNQRFDQRYARPDQQQANGLRQFSQPSPQQYPASQPSPNRGGQASWRSRGKGRGRATTFTQRDRTPQVPTDAPCGWCGRGPPHARDQCPAREVTCFKCGKVGHFRSLCRSMRRSTE
jgi:hypothetical protein